MSKFTPGPWAISRPSDTVVKSNYVCLMPKKDIDDGNCRNYIARINIAIEDGDVESNMNLIAAAPDLLNIVEAMIAQINYEESSGYVSTPLRSLRDLAKKFIAAAINDK